MAVRKWVIKIVYRGREGLTLSEVPKSSRAKALEAWRYTSKKDGVIACALFMPNGRVLFDDGETDRCQFLLKNPIRMYQPTDDVGSSFGENSQRPPERSTLSPSSKALALLRERRGG